MEKIENVNYDKEYFNNLFYTDYDELFNYKIRHKGMGYYISNKVTKFHKKDKMISAIVKGTNDYNVSVEYLNNNEIKVKCDCAYHNDTNPYCKHVYALIMYKKMIPEKQNMINIYNNNTSRIKDIQNEIKTIITDNKGILDSSIYSWELKMLTEYDECLEKMKEEFDEKKDYKLIFLINKSYFFLNSIIDEYNEIFDNIENAKRKIESENDKSDVTTYSIKLDDSKLYDGIDEKVSDLDLSILEKVRQEDIKNGESTEIIDKAIRGRKRKNALINNKKEKSNNRHLFLGLLASSFDSDFKSSSHDNDYLMPWEKDLVNERKYESNSFEEEELEDDDYYFEDD